MSGEDLQSVRVNSARLPQYIGKPVRLVCKVKGFVGNTAQVEATDGGEISVQLNGNHISNTYVEIIGNVVDATTIKALLCIDLGADLDMKLVNDVIELSHDPRFKEKVFGPPS